MAIELRILSGSRAGQREAFEKSVVTIGRHPICDLRFDAHADLDVSARHAEIRGVDGRYTIHDNQSTNGTYVNNERVTDTRELREGDTIRFGASGPSASVHLRPAAVDAPLAAAARAAPAAPAAPLRRP